MYPAQPNNKKQKAVTAFAVVVIAGILLAAATAFNNNPTPGTPSTAQTATQQSPTTNQQTDASSSTGVDSSSTGTASAAYNNGTYTATSEYNVPRSFETIKVSLTIDNGVVTASQIENSEGDRESAEYQERFAAVYKSYVVGKKLDDIHLSYVAGASDTTDGFNGALQQIKNQAQS